MGDNEIVKGLEVCQNISGETCDDCPYEESKHLDEVMPNGLNYDQMSCDMWLQMDSLDLINRQKAEIERLHNVNCENTDRFSKLLEATRKNGKSTSRMVEEEAVREFEKRILLLFPADKDFTTISRYSVKKISKEMIKIIKE